MQCGCAAGLDWSLVARAWWCSFCTAADSVLIRKRDAGDGTCCHNKFRSSCPNSMGQNRLLVRLTSPQYTPTYRADSAGAVEAQVTDSSGSQISGPAVWRKDVNRGYRTLQAQSYLYSVYRFTLTHHGAGTRIKNTAAYYKKKNPHKFYEQTKSKSIIYIWQLAVK